MENTFKNSKVLVAGGTGMIGIQLVKLLIDNGAKVRIVSLDDPKRAHPDAEFLRLDLRDFTNCQHACQGMDYIFNLLCVKGSPTIMKKKPASAFVPMILFNTNLAEATRQAKVKWYLYTSTVGVYAPAPVLKEDMVWKTFPSENDKFAGWAKRMGELQLESYKIEYGFSQYSIIRPPNVYGTFDNFDPKNSMVVPALIKRACDGEDPLVVWGDGAAIRDFIHAKDVARAMLFVVENKISEPINVGSGTGVSIKQLVEIIVNNLEKKPKIVWDRTLPSGDAKRLMDISKISSYSFKNTISIEQGIKELIDWYRENRNNLEMGYNVFYENKL